MAVELDSQAFQGRVEHGSSANHGGDSAPSRLTSRPHTPHHRHPDPAARCTRPPRGTAVPPRRPTGSTSLPRTARSACWTAQITVALVASRHLADGWWRWPGHHRGFYSIPKGDRDARPCSWKNPRGNGRAGPATGSGVGTALAGPGLTGFDRPGERSGNSLRFILVSPASPALIT
jgi:hypothetical protein